MIEILLRLLSSRANLRTGAVVNVTLNYPLEVALKTDEVPKRVHAKAELVQRETWRQQTRRHLRTGALVSSLLRIHSRLPLELEF